MGRVDYRGAHIQQFLPALFDSLDIITKDWQPWIEAHRRKIRWPLYLRVGLIAKDISITQ